MSKRQQAHLRIFTSEDVAQHNTSNSCWVIVNRKVYDVTAFAGDHPGGNELILNRAGQDVTAIMEDPDEHSHSDSAYDLLADYSIGLIGNLETTCSESNEVDEYFSPEETALDADFERNQFLDLKKPLIMQMLTANFSKSFYLHQVHQPRYLPYPARFFGPTWMEMLTRTSWYVVPSIWLPIAAFLVYKSLSQQSVFNAATGAVEIPASAYPVTLACFLFGNFVWTILEYVFHRFLFHVDEYLPDHPYALTVHFLMHGVHHYLPCDRLRLVMPPVMFSALSFPMTRLAYALFPVAIANGIIAGSFTFYVLYDCMHYALHHTQLPKHLKNMKVYHMAHHFKNADLGFGVTSKIWDYVFRTELNV